MDSRAGILRAIIGAAALLLAPTHGALAQGSQTTPPPPPPATAPPTDPPNAFQFLRFGATLEGYYEYNGNHPFDRVNLLRAYDTRANVFGIQQATMVVESVPDVQAARRFGARIDLQFGQATETVQGNPVNEPRPEVMRHIWQAYGTYVFPVGRGLQMDFGKFASNLGFETNYAKDNNQFSRSFLFNVLPFYHSGVRLSLPLSDRVTVMYMLTNGIQQTEDFNNFKSSHVTAIVTPVTGVTWTTSYYFGQEQPDGSLPNGPDGFFRVFDTYASYAAGAHLNLGMDVTHVTNQVTRSDPTLSLTGVGAYARYQAGSAGALSLRYEWLNDEGLFAGLAQELQEVTCTAEYRFADGFLMRGELRRDWSNNRVFTGAAPGDLRAGQTTALVGLVWWFGNKRGTW